MIEKLPDDLDISVFVSTDGYEMVIPMFNKSMSRINSFVGMDTAKVYDQAKLRTDRDLRSYKMQTKMGNWQSIVKWFSLSSEQANNINNLSTIWMIDIADRIKRLGYDGESIISLEIVNDAIRKDEE